MTKEKSKSLNGYKLYCVNGEPLYVMEYTDRVAYSHDMKCTIYNMACQLHQKSSGRLAVSGSDIEWPKSFNLMKGMAAKLSSPYRFVRIDFYAINDKPVFGEMTFTQGMQETLTEF